MRDIVLTIPVVVGTSEVEVPGEETCAMQRQLIPVEINAPLIENYFFLMWHWIFKKLAQILVIFDSYNALTQMVACGLLARTLHPSGALYLGEGDFAIALMHA